MRRGLGTPWGNRAHSAVFKAPVKGMRCAYNNDAAEVHRRRPTDIEVYLVAGRILQDHLIMQRALENLTTTLQSKLGRSGRKYAALPRGPRPLQHRADRFSAFVPPLAKNHLLGGQTSRPVANDDGVAHRWFKRESFRFGFRFYR
jgi:hypothetical protein